MSTTDDRTSKSPGTPATALKPLCGTCGAKVSGNASEIKRRQAASVSGDIFCSIKCSSAELARREAVKRMERRNNNKDGLE